MVLEEEQRQTKIQKLNRYIHCQNKKTKNKEKLDSWVVRANAPLL
jgi:hypothetical protein